MPDLSTYIYAVAGASWHMLLESSVFILFGLLVGGLLKVFMSPEYVVTHLGTGRFKPVFKAALLGIPIPLCSCGVLPAAASLKKQGANNGATTAFLVSTPESGVDSISISWALLDPLMTLFRPLSAFISAFVAGAAENLVNPPGPADTVQADQSCTVDNCCDGTSCSPDDHLHHHSLTEKLAAGLRYAVTELWSDLAVSFFIGIILAGLITVLIPDDFFHMYLGGGFKSMLLMLVVGVPLYICATASTPVAAAFILKGVSPGAALVFLLVGPATNIASLSMLNGLLGKRATTVYLISISIISVLCGLVLDQVYSVLGISAQVTVGQATEILPYWLKVLSTLLIIALSIRPVLAFLRKKFFSKRVDCGCSGTACTSLQNNIAASAPEENHAACESGCTCSGHNH